MHRGFAVRLTWNCSLFPGLISVGSSTPLRETAGALDAFNLPLVSVVSPHSDGDGADDVAQGRNDAVISSPSLQIALLTS